MSGMKRRHYREMRHGARECLSFIRNYAYLRFIRYRIKSNTPERKIIAINLLEHIGDIVATEPISRYMRQRNPDAYILWLVKKPYRELIDHNPHINKTVIVHCLTERMHLSECGLFDEVFDLHFYDRYCSLCRKPLKKTGTRNAINLQNYFNFGGILTALSQSADLPALDEPPKVYIPEALVQNVDSLNLPEHFIVINCSSNHVKKDWPASKWLELTENIIARYNVPVVEVGASPLLSCSQHPKYINLCGRLSILESAEVIRRAGLFIGIDSGPAHLANAVGTYGVILMGSYLGFEKYNPFSGCYRNGENAAIIYKCGSVADISVDRVLQTVEKVIGRKKIGMSNVV